MKRRLLALVLPLALVACASRTSAPKPADLVAFTPEVQARQAWSLKLAAIDFALKPQVSGNGQLLTLATGDGTVLQLDASTGREVWRHAVGAPLAAGVGSDGRLAAVVTRRNELVVLEQGQPLWRQRLPVQAHTAPLVAGERVFVLTADRSVSAFDGRTGTRLWSQQRPGSDPLVLRQAGVLLAVGDTLVAGLSGRMVGLNPLNGTVRWEAPVATPRGINEIERLVDLVDPPARQANVVCARAFQAAVGCINADNASVLWSRAADGVAGVAADESRVFGSESNGHVLAWRRSDGERAWSQERLRQRGLTAPAVVGRSVAVGDYQGHVHLLSRDDGRLIGRLSTDGSAVAGAPVLVGNTLVVMTRAGGVFGFVPQ